MQPTSPGGRDGPPVPVATVPSTAEAELIVGMLRNNGVRAAVSADDAGGTEPELQNQGVRVLVIPSDEALARQLLATVDDSASAVDEPDTTDSSSPKTGQLNAWQRWMRGLRRTRRS